MKIKQLLVLLICLVTSITISAQNNTSEKITTGPGPEDIVFNSFFEKPELIISTCSRRDHLKEYGEIEVYDLESGSIIILPRIKEPPNLSFNPHGIDLIKIDNQVFLYVILHDDFGKKHPVVRYILKEDHLVFDRIYQNELLISPNALAVFDDGSFLVCNDAAKRGSKIEQILGIKSGNILFFDQSGNVSVVAKKLGMPAGMNRIGSKIFVSCATENKIFSYDFNNNKLSNKRLLARIKGPDNIRISEGKLLIANHPKMMKFIKHIGNAENLSPGSIYSVNASTGEMNNIFLNSGEIISAASVAIEFGPNLYIGQIFESFIVKVGL